MLLHVLFVLVAWYSMRPPTTRPAPATTPGEFMQVRFISLSPPTVVPPPPALQVPPPPASPRPPPVVEAPAKGALVLSPTPTPPPLYDKNGQPILPAASGSAPVPGYVQPLPQGDRRIMRHDSPVTYQSTRFEKDWHSGGNAFDSALQKLVDKTTLKKTIHLPRGVRIHCAVSIAMLAGGCGGDPPPPPSAKDGDERLNMAPAASLDGRPHGPAPPSVEQCIAMYRAGKPLAHGCPVDTPNRSVDAEAQAHRPAAAKQP